MEEADEVVFWLELLGDASIIEKVRLSELTKEATELLAVFVASQRTVKGHEHAALKWGNEKMAKWMNS